MDHHHHDDGQLGYLRKSESMSGHVPVLFMCCEYHFLDGTIMNFLFLINSYSKNPTTSHHHRDHDDDHDAIVIDGELVFEVKSLG